MSEVYHLTSSKNLPQILAEGLRPDPATRRLIKVNNFNLESFIDGARPDWVIDMGITRLGAVYGHPSLSYVNRESMGASVVPFSYRHYPVAVGFDVDPEKVILGDANRLPRIYSRVLDTMQGSSYVYDDLLQIGRDYWDQAMTYAEFLDEYRYEDEVHGYIRKGPTAPDQTTELRMPEILGPSHIAPESVRYVASLLAGPIPQII